MDIAATSRVGDLEFSRSEPVLAIHARAHPLETATNKVLAWGIGLLAGVLTVRTEYVGSPTDLFSRVAPVDFLCLALLAMLFLHHKMQPLLVRAVVYGAAIILSLIPALLFSQESRHDFVLVTAAGLVMAFGYYLIGLNIGASPTLIRCLLGGLCVGVLGQAVIVIHDSMVSQYGQWFPDPMAGRARGTFKTNGQLGAYSFCAAGLLLTFGATLGSKAFRRMCVALGILATTFVFMASRRTGMGCMLLWGALFIVRGWRFSERWSYRTFFAGFFASLVALALLWPVLQHTFVGERFMAAVNGIMKEDGFIQSQARNIVGTTDNWFPFGIGVGQGAEINPDEEHEIHNGFLAVLVELGVLGALGFGAMLLFPLLKKEWRQRSYDHRWLGVLMTTFLIISLVFIMHNTLARDRLFMLYLGIATTVVLQESRLHSPSVYFPKTKN